MGVGMLPPGLGIAGELGWNVSSGSRNGGFGPAEDKVVERVGCRYRVGPWKRRRKRAAWHPKHRRVVPHHPNHRCPMIVLEMNAWVQPNRANPFGLVAT
jgi:hypothetical protein